MDVMWSSLIELLLLILVKLLWWWRWLCVSVIRDLLDWDLVIHGGHGGGGGGGIDLLGGRWWSSGVSG